MTDYQKRRRFSSFSLSLIDLQRFTSLPLSILTEVCRFLDPINLICLAWSCKALRERFMSVTAKPLWDAARTLQGVPDWRGVSGPQAAVFLFTGECQGPGCDKVGELEAFSLCRRYCRECAEENLLDWKKVAEAFPHLPLGLLERLPSFISRTPELNEYAQSTQYYLKQDVLKLWRLVEMYPHETPAQIAALHQQLVPGQRARRKATADVRSWDYKAKGERRQVFRNRWTKIQSFLRKRCGWEPVPYDQLSSTLSRMVGYFLNVPELTNQVLESECGHCTLIVRADAQVRSSPNRRPFSLAVSK